MKKFQFINQLKSSTRLHFLVKAAKHFGDRDYLEFFINRENLPLLLEFETRGEGCRGKCVYLIEENGKGLGYFAEFNTMLMELMYADCFHLQPYVNWGKGFLYYEEEIKDYRNAFSYFFEPINGSFADEIESAELLTRAKPGQADWIQQKYDKGYDLSIPFIKVAAETYRRYIKLNAYTQEKIIAEMNALLHDKRTLAVHYRGTDFKMNYDKHPVCVELEEQIEVVKNALERHSFEQIFLATDDYAAITLYQETFGDTVVFYRDVKRSSDKVSVAFSESDRQYHHYFLAYEVLRDMLTMSVCDGLIAGVSQVSIATRIAKASRGEEYSYVKIIDKGKNNNYRRFKEEKQCSSGSS